MGVDGMELEIQRPTLHLSGRSFSSKRDGCEREKTADGELGFSTWENKGG